MRDYGKGRTYKVERVVSGVAGWAQIISYDRGGILITEEDPCVTHRWDDIAMAYTLHGIAGVPEGTHFLPLSWLDTLKEEEDVGHAVQMRVFGEVRYA